MNRKALVSSAVAIFGASTALAEQPVGPYLGLLGGSAAIERDIDEVSTFKADKFTLGVTLGYQITRNFAIEAGYLRPAKFSTSFSDGGDDYDISARIYGLTASAVISWPVSDTFAIFGRIGAAAAHEKYSVVMNGTPLGSASDDTTDVLVGGGVSFSLGNSSVRAEYQRAEYDYGSVGIAALNVLWSFGSGG